MLLKTTNKMFILITMLIALVVIACVSLTFGQIDISLKSAIGVLCHQWDLPFYADEFTQEDMAVVWHIRVPRMLVGILVGAALGMAGAVMQGIFSNPLAEPGIIGVSAGAATGAVVAIALGFTAQTMFAMPMMAFIGSILTVFITVFLAMKRGKIPVMTLLLAGVAVGMLMSALTSGMLTFMNEHKLHQYLFWIVGGLDYRRWEHVYIAAPFVISGVIIMMLLARHLNILALGETEAKSVGMPVMAFRMGLLAVASMTTAASVCVSGNIGFVGLIVPHMMRILLGPDHRILLPASALGGAIFLVTCDAIGRAVIAPSEIRVGIMTALLGAPYFLYLLRKMHKESF